MTKVFIAQANEGSQYHKMFEEAGWEVVQSVSEADLIQFIGGADVNPALYHHKVHPTTSFNTLVDTVDAQFFELGKRHNIPMAGICRGGQFLNVSNGGTMVQHCDNHGVHAGHYAIDKNSGATIRVSSTHHQMMIPSEDAEVIAIANEATTKQVYIKTIKDLQEYMVDDIEVVYYEKTNCLCFQPHPEFNGFPQCRQYYFTLLEKYLGVG